MEVVTELANMTISSHYHYSETNTREILVQKLKIQLDQSSETVALIF